MLHHYVFIKSCKLSLHHQTLCAICKMYLTVELLQTEQTRLITLKLQQNCTLVSHTNLPLDANKPLQEAPGICIFSSIFKVTSIDTSIQQVQVFRSAYVSRPPVTFVTHGLLAQRPNATAARCRGGDHDTRGE